MTRSDALRAPEGATTAEPDESAPLVVVFAPSPILTITIEGDLDDPGDADVHVHAGGQGVWQARMLRSLGARVRVVAALAGETGQVLRDLLRDEGLELVAVERAGKGAAYIHDRRGGDREPVVETAGDALSRHELDELYGLALREGLRADAVVLSGPVGDEVLPADTYRRLAADLRAGDALTVVDLAGDRLAAALGAGVDVVKVSHEELIADGRIADGEQGDLGRLAEAMRGVRDDGARIVIVTRAADPALVLHDDVLLEVTGPTVEVVDHTGAGDSFTAATTAVLAAGGAVRDAVALGAAAGAVNSTRHGLGTGDPETVRQVAEAVRIRELRGDGTTTED
jgi:1-phosphofructokinase